MKDNDGRKPDHAKASQSSPMKSIFEKSLSKLISMATDLGDWHSFEGSEAVDKQEKKVKLAHQKDIDSAVKEARYMGSMDFATWVLNHDESSFRQEKAWYKIKPSLILEYQAELMKNIDRVRTNIGLDPESTVSQLSHATEVLPDDPSRAKTEPTESKPGRQLEDKK